MFSAALQSKIDAVCSTYKHINLSAVSQCQNICQSFKRTILQSEWYAGKMPALVVPFQYSFT